MADARRYTVHGRVQGVGYRFYAYTCADALGVTGWVRNTPEGTVEVHAEGSEEQLRELGFDLRRGPRYGRVTRVEEADAEPEGGAGFRIRRGGA